MTHLQIIVMYYNLVGSKKQKKKKVCSGCVIAIIHISPTNVLGIPDTLVTSHGSLATFTT